MIEFNCVDPWFAKINLKLNSSVFAGFNQIWVSTDDAEISKEALKAGALVHARHPATALDSTPSLVAVQEFMAIHSGNKIHWYSFLVVYMWKISRLAIK